MAKKFSVVIMAVCVLPSLVWAWGGTGHKLINKNSVLHLPASMQQLKNQQSVLEAHASDADNRKSADPTEDVKHFIDIDTYPDFRDRILSYDSLSGIYGAAFVTNEGTLPWATKATLDSLTRQFRRGDFSKAYLTASDLGHYVGDGHQPLHLTKNYNGGMTGNSGIHSRYESSMFNTYAGTIVITADSARYIPDPVSYIFRYINRTTVYTDSIMKADSEAKAAAGGSTSSSAYYAALWARTGSYTKKFMQEATVDLASFYYTAWVDAGLLYSITSVGETQALNPAHVRLDPAYPNPFNPSATLRFTTQNAGRVRLAIFDVLGREVERLIDADLASGSYAVSWNASSHPSGIYYCRMQSGGYAVVQKLVLQR
ncbi:MAG: T9SS type A sorting domain-containing protein [Acidobacteriota bacterium]